MADKIALVRNDSEVDLLKKTLDDPDVLWIPLEPFCISKLKRENLRYFIADDLYTIQELFQEASLFADATKTTITNQIDKWINSNYKELADSNIGVLKFYNYYLQILFDGTISRIFILQKIFLSFNQAEFYICINQPVNPANNSTEYPWQSHENPWAYCVQALTHRTEHSVQLIHYQGTGIKLAGGKTPVNKRLQKKCPALHIVLKFLKEKGAGRTFHLLRNKRILCLDPKPQWYFTEKLFHQYGYEIIDLIIPPDFFTSENCIDFVTKANVQNTLIYKGVDFSSVVHNKLNGIIQYGISTFYEEYNRNLKILRIIRPKALFFSIAAAPRKWIVMHAAKALGIPTFCWSHGASGNELFSKQRASELLVTDFYLSQGKGSSWCYSNYPGESSAKIITTGIPSIDTLKINTTLPPRYLFLYVTTGYYHNHFYFNFYPGIPSNDLYLSSCTILDCISNFDKPSLIKPATEPLAMYNPYLQNKSLHFSPDQRFIDLIHQAEAIIIDAPTTTLLESLTTNKPIYVLTKYINLNPLAEKLLKKRAICEESISTLIERIEVFANSRDYSADVNNDEYLKAFGTYQNNGKSAVRCVQTVINNL